MKLRAVMVLNYSTFTGLFLVSVLTAGALSAAVRERETVHEEDAALDFLFDPEPVKEHLTLMDDYGVRPVPPRVPSYLLRA